LFGMTDDAAPRREPVAPDDEDLSPDIDELDSPDRADRDGADQDGSPAVDGSGQAAADNPPDATTPAAPAEPPSGRRAVRAEKHRKPSRWWEFPVLAAVAILVAILVKSFIVQPFYIPSQSMEKTLHGCPGCNGDKILVNKVVYHSRNPHAGEIIVFKAPDGWESEAPTSSSSNPVVGAVRWFGQLVGVVPPDEHDLVKRVIAVGGQAVRCCDAQGNVQISDNGTSGPWRSLQESYVFEDGPDGNQTFGPVLVPKGRLWVMGDHRNDSADSRYHCGVSLTECDPTESTVPLSAVIGKAFVIAWPVSRWRTLGTPSTFTSSAGAEAASAMPLFAGAIVVLPIWLWRRRRRRT
jgi:signal peptidase I